MTYLDAASACPLHPAGRTALLAALDDGWADPARLHREGRRARALLDGAREAIAAAAGARAAEVSFPGSGTAAVHLALLGGLAARRRIGRQLVHSAVEHRSVREAAEFHQAAGGTVNTVPVDRLGRVDPAAYAAALSPDTALASLQSANHEVGTVQPVAAVAAAARRVRVPLHVDAAQSVGQVPVDMNELGADLLTASAHKWGGPAGVGLLVIRTGTRWRSPWPGGGEGAGGRVAGFVDVPAILAAAAALTARVAEMDVLAARQAALVDLIRARAGAEVVDVEVLGDPRGRLPHIVTLSFPFLPGEPLVHELARAGYAVSGGSSCAADAITPSHVLEAMGILTSGSIRISVHPGTTRAEVSGLLAALPAAVDRCRGRG
jgi:cysteine desulfurase